MAESSTPTDPPRPVVAATPARQGLRGTHLFWVLVIGTALAAIGLFLAWTWKAPSLAAADAKLASTHAQSAPAFTAPEPAPIASPPAADQPAPQPH
jgi:ABC-type uncharacterized transport system involved in gliding motility auxiliary subunit